MKKAHVAVALTLVLLPCAYAAQAGMKLKRLLDPTPLSECNVSVCTERESLGAISLPIPKVICMGKPKNNTHTLYVWTPTQNAWVPVVFTTRT